MSFPRTPPPDPWRERVAAALSVLERGGGAPDYDRALRDELQELEAAVGIVPDDVSRAHPLALLHRRVMLEEQTSRRSLVELPSPWGHLALLASTEARELCIELAARAVGAGLATESNRVRELRLLLGPDAWPAVESRMRDAQGSSASAACSEAVQSLMDSSAARQGRSALSRLGRVLLARPWQELPAETRKSGRSVALSNLFDLLESERGLAADDCGARLSEWLGELLSPRTATPQQDSLQ